MDKFNSLQAEKNDFKSFELIQKLSAPELSFSCLQVKFI